MEESEFEETLILLNFCEFEDLTLLHSESQIELIHLDSLNPTCQIIGLKDSKGEYSKLSFSGKHQFSLGTKILFPVEYNHELDSNSSDNEDKSIHMVTKIINFSLCHIENVTNSAEEEEES